MKKYVLLGTEIEQKYYPLIHKLISKKLNKKIKYKIVDIKNEKELDNLLLNLKLKVYDGINIETYKNTLIQTKLDKLTEKSQVFGYTNTVNCIDNKLIGSNTDYNSILETFLQNDINPINKNVIIIGTGQLSKVVQQFLKDFKVNNIFILNLSKILVSNNYRIKYLNKLELKTLKNIDIIINTVAVGQFPEYNEIPLLEKDLPDVKYAIDLVYYPYKTVFLMAYAKKGVKIIDGLYTQIIKAVKSQAIWYDDKSLYDYNLINEVYEEMKNIVNKEY